MLYKISWLSGCPGVYRVSHLIVREILPCFVLGVPLPASCSSGPQASLKLSRKTSMNDGMGNSVQVDVFLYWNCQCNCFLTQVAIDSILLKVENEKWYVKRQSSRKSGTIRCIINFHHPWAWGARARRNWARSPCWCGRWAATRCGRGWNNGDNGESYDWDEWSNIYNLGRPLIHDILLFFSLRVVRACLGSR